MGNSNIHGYASLGRYILSISVISLFMAGGARAGELSDALDQSTVAPVTITASRSARVQADRRSYDVKVNPDLQTLNAQEVVARLPGVVTDLQGRLSVLGQTAISYRINDEGVPAALALQIPAAQIERIEMITNPGADAKGSTRVIINFVLKAPRVKAYGVARGQGDTLDRRELSLMIGRSINGIDLTANVSFSQEPQERRTSYDQDFFAGEEAGLSLTRIGQEHAEDIRRQGQFMAGFERGPWSYVAVAFLLDQAFRAERNRAERQSLIGRTAQDFGIEESSDLENRSEAIAFIAQRKRGAHTKDSWSVTPRWSSSEGRFSQALTNLDRPDFSSWQRSKGEGLDAKLTLERGDTTAELLKLGIEAGRDRGRVSHRVVGYGEPQARFDYTRESASAYVTRQLARGGLEALPGLRIEAARLYSRAEGAERVKNVAVVRALPSLHLVYTPDGKSKLRASLAWRGGDIVAERYDTTRRRTAYNGFRQGDAGLKLEDQLNLEASYERVSTGRAFIGTIYARRIRNSSQTYYDYLGREEYIDRYINIDRVDRFGVNLNIKSNIGNRGEIIIDLNAYEEARDWDIGGVFKNDSSSKIDVKINGNFRFDTKNNILIILQYNGKENGLETTYSSRISSSIKYTKLISKNLNMSLEGIDFLSTRQRKVSRAAVLYNSISITDQSKRALRLTLSRSF